MERAQQGLTRLTHILTRMTEATRLEESLGDDERERFDLAQVVAGCVDGYRSAYPRHNLRLDLPSGEAMFNGAPELIAQMLDKLVANAVEFSAEGTPSSFAWSATTPGYACRWKTKDRRCPTP